MGTEETDQKTYAAKQLRAALQELEDAYGDLDQNIENHGATLSGVSAKTRAQKEALLDALKAQRRYAKAMGDSAEDLARMAKGIDDLKASLKNLSGYASSFSSQIRGMMGMALYRYEDEGKWFSSKSLVSFMFDMENRRGGVNTSHYRITSLMRQIVRASPSYVQRHTPNGILFRKTI